MLRSGVNRALQLGVMLLVAMLAAAVGAEDDGARRAEALADLKSPSAESREAACETLGRTGRDADLPLLMSALHDSAGEVRKAAEAAIWRIWSRSGDVEADRVFDIGMSQLQAGDLGEAAQTFGRVIAMKPEFAEGWNKRATVYF